MRRFQVDQLEVQVHATNQDLGLAAARQARDFLAVAIETHGTAHLVLAAANSQLTFLHALRRLPDVPWPQIRVFQMDEYVGLPEEHPARFGTFLRRHLLDHVRPLQFMPLGTGNPPQRCCEEYADLLARFPPDLVVMGWGENGHIAFNDPPDARFDDPVAVKAVTLALASRLQQVGEGHFPDLASVPTHAVTLTIPTLLAARNVLCLVPESRKAAIVRDCLTLPISEARLGSVLRRVRGSRLLLDADSAALLPTVRPSS